MLGILVNRNFSVPKYHSAAQVKAPARHKLFWMGALSIGLLAMAAMGNAHADNGHAVPQREHKPFPQIKLSKRLQGDAAVAALGDRLPEVAAWYGKSADAFARELRHDKRAMLDRDGRLLYIDDFPTPANATTATSGSTVSAAAPFPTDQTFLLHSRPGAKRVIYLDFQGQVVTGTAWNSSYSLSTIDAKAYDLDGDPTTFNATELERIQYIWQRVAEDYAPFDVDITTEEPPSSAINRSSSTDDTFGTRVVITNDWTALTASPCGCGGFAYVGIFDDVGDGYKPAWVFFDQLGSGNEKYVAEAISHEAGHNLGLSHDGTSTVGYYAGHGSGATGWAPIMGVGYYKELVQWSKGEYPGANQFQDDVQVIQTTGGTLRIDDHGDTIGAATPLDVSPNGSTNSLAGQGVISTRTDVDAFSFQTGPGTFSLNVAPASRGPNLDILARLYDGAGTLLASANPTDTLNAALSYTSASGGTYYLLVDGTGKGTLTDGYSDYGSLGAYAITGTAPQSGGQAPFAIASATPTSGTAPLAVNFTGSNSYDPDGGSLTYDWDFGDGSSHSSAPNPSHTYSAGSFVAILRVTDTSGASALTQVGINATAPVVSIHVADITMGMTTKRSTYQAKATITVRDANGVAIPGAAVTGTWSGLVSGSSSGTTGTAGSLTLSSPTTKKTGTITFTVTGVSIAGYAYNSAANTETSDSISVGATSTIR